MATDGIYGKVFLFVNNAVLNELRTLYIYKKNNLKIPSIARSAQTCVVDLRSIFRKLQFGVGFDAIIVLDCFS